MTEQWKVKMSWKNGQICKTPLGPRLIHTAGYNQMKSRSWHNINLKWVTPPLNNFVLEQSLFLLTWIPNRNNRWITLDHPPLYRLPAILSVQVPPHFLALLASLPVFHHVLTSPGPELANGPPASTPAPSASLHDSTLQDLFLWSRVDLGVPVVTTLEGVSCNQIKSQICNHSPESVSDLIHTWLFCPHKPLVSLLLV